MKRKNNFETVTLWTCFNSENSKIEFFEDLVFEEVDDLDLSLNVRNALLNCNKAFLKTTADSCVVLFNEKNEQLYELQVKDLKNSGFLMRYSEDSVHGMEIVLAKKTMSGMVFNKKQFEEENIEDNTKIIDKDCPECGHLLQEPLHEDDEDISLINCSNYLCDFIDDSNADFSINYRHFIKKLNQIRKDGGVGMELTAEQFAQAKLKLDIDNKKDEICPHCEKDKIEIVNIFAKKEYGDFLYNYLCKCRRCHETTFSFQLSKNDPFSKAIFGPRD
jgi:ssDNA-binding Zn-finger/Zn-ribbon topoisomerase 1